MVGVGVIVAVVVLVGVVLGVAVNMAVCVADAKGVGDEVAVGVGDVCPPLPGARSTATNPAQ